MLLAGLLILAAQQKAPFRLERPNVVLVIADDVGVIDAQSVNTPALDSLVSSGVTFTRAFANPVCSPTRRALMFGRWWGTGSGTVCGPPQPETPPEGAFSVAKLMKIGGYRTALFGKWHVGSNRLGAWEDSPRIHGFDTWRAGLPMNVRSCGGNDYRDWTRVDDGVNRNSTEYQTIAVRDAFLDWWTRTPGAKFAVVAYQAAHGPFHRPPAELLPPNYPGTLSSRDRYEAMIVSLDHVLGEMLAVIDLADTYVIFIGDNGTPQTVAPDPTRAKGTTFERGIHVPLVVAHSGLTPAVSSALVHAVDLTATIAELGGIPIPVEMDSRSFVRCLSKPTARTRSFVYCQDADDRCVRSQRYKLRVDAGVEEFYDLLVDPAESSPLDVTDPLVLPLVERFRDVMASIGL